MKAIFLRLALLAAAMAPVSSVLAADLDIPPPVDDLRPATYDWSGAYVGVFAGGIFTEGHYDTTEICVVGPPPGPCGTYDPEMSGNGWQAGLLAGVNYQMDDFVFGIEGDWSFGGETAQNREPAERTKLDFDNVATLRARAGIAFDRTLIYATAGAAFLDTTFSSDDAPMGSGLSISDSKWITGWVAGGGIEHAFADSITGRLEYLYLALPDTSYDLQNAAVAGRVDQHWDNAHLVRAALTYNFSL